MNIFVTDDDPVACAMALDDKRVGKMIMETNQMLSVAIKICCPHLNWFDEVHPAGLTQGVAYATHPCTLWAMGSRENFQWLLDHGHALDREFTHRRGFKHQSGVRLQVLERYRDCLHPLCLLPFANCAKNDGKGIDFTHLPVPESYRHYLAARWDTDKNPVTFTGRSKPAWILSL